MIAFQPPTNSRCNCICSPKTGQIARRALILSLICMPLCYITAHRALPALLKRVGLVTIIFFWDLSTLSSDPSDDLHLFRSRVTGCRQSNFNGTMQPLRFQLENATSFSHYHDIYLLILNHLLFFFSSSQVLVFLTSHALLSSILMLST